ncbi:MAG: hypothetical protein K2O56_05710 [Muribaculaceae bacterium]|nr:hypothetical protein [Muribaculaceae bacterium]
MKKFLLTIAAFAAFTAANAQETYNYFDPADCDADGWLWFDTQAKLDKYCGYTSDFKIILSGAQYEGNDGQYADCVLDGTIVGYDKEGNQGGAGSWTGAIITPQAKSYGSQNGGGIILSLPDLAEFSVAMSADARIRQMVLMGSKEAGTAERIDMGIVTGFAFPFTSLTSDFQYSWNNLQNLKNQNTGLTLASPKGTHVTAGLFNDMTSEVLIQGIKVFTYTKTDYPEGSGVAGIVTDDSDAPVEFFNMQGVKVSGDEPGLYIRRQGSKTSKIIVK